MRKNAIAVAWMVVLRAGCGVAQRPYTFQTVRPHADLVSDLVRGLVLCATSATYSHNLPYRTLWRGMGLMQLGLRLLPRSAWERGLQAQAEGKIPRVLTRLVHPGTPAHIPG